jgi:hypothetical protein
MKRQTKVDSATRQETMPRRVFIPDRIRRVGMLASRHCAACIAKRTSARIPKAARSPPLN